MTADYAKKFNDNVAAITSWAPLKEGGASFKTYKLVSVSPSRLEFRSTWYAILFYTVFTGLGSGLVIASLYNAFSETFQVENLSILQITAGLIFLFSGLTMFIKNVAPVVFDKSLGYYWKGFKKPRHDSIYKKPDVFFRIIDIYALQLISELVKGNKRSYFSYELNIIYRDGNRKNIVDHGNIEKLREDAEKLSSFINRPLWSDTREKDGYLNDL